MASKNKSDKEVFWKVAALIVPVFCVVLTHMLTNASVQNKIVDQLSDYFDGVDETMTYEKALRTVYDNSVHKDQKINELDAQLNEYCNQIDILQSQISSMPNLEYHDVSLISDGLRVQNQITQSVLQIGDNTFYSDGIINAAIGDKIAFDPLENVVYFNTSGNKIKAETKVALLDTDVLYDGTCYKVFYPSDGNTFSMGSNTYSNGFELFDDHSLFGDGDGFALFDLQGKYSTISFDIGRTNEYEKQDVTLKVYLNGEFVEKYEINAQSPPIPLTINLNYANDLKLEITGGSRVKYGFANVILEY